MEHSTYALTLYVTELGLHIKRLNLQFYSFWDLDFFCLECLYNALIKLW